MGQHQYHHSQKPVRQQNKREIFQHLQGSWQTPAHLTPAQVSTQEMLAGEREEDRVSLPGKVKLLKIIL